MYCFIHLIYKTTIKIGAGWPRRSKLPKYLETPQSLNGGYYQSEGFPLTGYFIPGRVGSWVWPSSKIVVVVVCVRVPASWGRLGGGLGEKINAFNVKCMILT